MKRVFALILGSVFWCSPAFGQGVSEKILYFPQVVIGGGQVNPDGSVIDGWEFSYKQMNKTSLYHEVEVTSSVYDSQGKPTPYKFFMKLQENGGKALSEIDQHGIPGWWFKTISGMSGYYVNTITIAATPEDPGLRIGWAQVRQQFSATEDIVVSGTLLMYSQGKVVSQVGVPVVEAAVENHVQIYLSEADSQATGIAIANPYYDEEVSVTLEVLKSGTMFAKKTIVLPKAGHLSKFFSELFPEYAREKEWLRSKSFGAVLKITSSKPVPVLALDTRQVPGETFFMSILAAK